MESKKINQLATELTPALDDLTIIGDPTTGISKKITLSQMASLFTGTVEEYANFAAFPLVGVADTIYIALDTNVLYRWNTGTSAYVELSPNIINSLVFNDANGFDGTIALVGSVATLTITTALTTGSVGFIGASGALLQDNANFFWDDTNNRLGLGTNAPTTAIDVFGSGIIGRLNGTSTNNAFLGFASAGTNRWSIGNVQSDHRFRIYNEATTSELVSVLSTGEFGIGIANPTTKFHIDGGASALIANLDANVSVAKSISFRSDNSNRFNIEVSGTESGSNAGADFFIRRYSDAGSLIDTPLTIIRSTGNATFSGILTTPQVKAATSAGLSINANSGTQVADFGAGGSANITFFGGLSGTSATFSGDLTIDTNTLYVDSTNNKVGISKLAPYTKLNLEGGHIGILSNSTAGTDAANDVRRAGYGFIHPDNKLLISAIINTSAATDWGLNLHFNTRATNAVMSATPAMTITSDQKVGIGMTTPYGKLQVSGGHVVIQGNSTAGTDGASDVRNAGYSFRKPSTDLISALINTTDVVDWGMNMHFFTRQSNAVMPATPVMTITADQKVGIGTIAPQAGLEIVTDSGTTNALRVVSNRAFNANTDVGITFRYMIDSTNFTSGGLIVAAKDNNTSGNQSGNMQFYVNSGSGLSEKMRILSSGTNYTDIVIGTTTTSYGGNAGRGTLTVGGSNTALYSLQIGGVNRTYLYSDSTSTFLDNASGTGDIVVVNGTGGVKLTRNATSWVSNSDERLKNINSTIENAIEKLLTLRTVNFSWKSDNTNAENIGLIAQDVEKVLPQLIHKSKLVSKIDEENTDQTEYLGVRYTELIPVLVKAIQELNAKIK